MSDKPIVIITTIYPFKNGKRPITVGAGPEGELVSLRSGVFADWQALERQAYGELLAAKPAAASKAKSGGKRKPAKRAKAAHRHVGSPAEPAGRRAGKPAAPEADQIGPAEPANGEAKNLGLLPEIEGDDAPEGGADETQLELTLESSDG